MRLVIFQVTFTVSWNRRSRLDNDGWGGWAAVVVRVVYFDQRAAIARRGFSNFDDAKRSGYNIRCHVLQSVKGFVSDIGFERRTSMINNANGTMTSHAMIRNDLAELWTHDPRW